MAGWGDKKDERSTSNIEWGKHGATVEYIGDRRRAF
jgi:hypothetical protein